MKGLLVAVWWHEVWLLCKDDSWHSHNMPFRSRGELRRPRWASGWPISWHDNNQHQLFLTLQAQLGSWWYRQIYFTSFQIEYRYLYLDPDSEIYFVKILFCSILKYIHICLKNFILNHYNDTFVLNCFHF